MTRAGGKVKLHRRVVSCRVPEETFDFLGYTLGNSYSAKSGRPIVDFN
jgi:hypothetical protein